MKLKPGFSIIIPCYNAGEFILETVDSITTQKFRYPFEVIIVDDCSTDKNTHESLQKIKDCEKVKIIKLPKHRGAQFARNTAIKESNFDFIFSIDADDLLNIDKEVLVDGTYPDEAIDMLINNSEIAFVHCTTLMFGDFSGLTISAYPVTEELLLKKHHAQISIVYRKQEALSAGLYDESIKKWQDWSFAIAILNHRFLAGKENIIIFIDKPHYLYRIYNDSNRVSSGKIDEREMVKTTYKRHPEIFKNYYHGLSNDEIIEKILSSKPDKLKDLLYVASHNLDRAIDMSEKRGFMIDGKKEPPNIP